MQRALRSCGVAAVLVVCTASRAQKDSKTARQSPDETQRNALVALRGSAKQAAERLAADCPQDVPAALSARLEAVEQGIDTALKAFDTVQPALQTFYGALDDEQKARLYRDMAAPAAGNAPQATSRRDRQEYSSRRNRWRAYASAEGAAGATGSRGEWREPAAGAVRGGRWR